MLQYPSILESTSWGIWDSSMLLQADKADYGRLRSIWLCSSLWSWFDSLSYCDSYSRTVVSGSCPCLVRLVALVQSEEINYSQSNCRISSSEEVLLLRLLRLRSGIIGVWNLFSDFCGTLVLFIVAAVGYYTIRWNCYYSISSVAAQSFCRRIWLSSTSSTD